MTPASLEARRDRPARLPRPSARTLATLLLLALGAVALRQAPELLEAPGAAAAAGPFGPLLAALALAAGYLALRCRRLSRQLVAQLAAERHSRDLAARDPLTGLGNRRGLSERLQQMTEAGPGEGRGFALLLLDLDRFKAVNDLHGHPAGDRLLRAVAHRLRASVRGLDRNVFRLGGDEFAVIVEATDQADDAPERVAHRIVDAMAAPFADSALRHHIGCSVGIAHFPLHGRDSSSLMRRADVALYQAKSEGRCCTRLFDPAMDAALQRRAAYEVAVRTAVEQREFYPIYQPIVALDSDVVTGFHMLARWRCPGEDAERAELARSGEGLGPAAFIRVAEECGLVGPLMLGLVAAACGDAARWGEKITLAVTPSPLQLRDPAFAQMLLATLREGGLRPARLAVKVSESAIVAARAAVTGNLSRLRDEGVTVELDGFGTGQLSLMELAMLPLDRIKLDRSFINALETYPETIAVARAIDSLARGLGMVLTADGVESPQAAERLRELGCAIGQGWHFGRPMGSEEAYRLVAGARAEACG